MKRATRIRDPGELYLTEDQRNHLDVKVGDIVIVQDDNGKHGRFLSVWKPTSEEDRSLAEKYNGQ